MLLHKKFHSWNYLPVVIIAVINLVPWFYFVILGFIGYGMTVTAVFVSVNIGSFLDTMAA